jgi:type II protein arginine methyltransferase
MDGSSLDAPVVDLSGDTDWHCHFERGKRCLAEGNYESAFATFCNIVRLQPEVRHSLETEFFVAYQHIAYQLISVHDMYAVFQLFQNAMSVFADSPLLHNDMGNLLYRLEHYQEAMGYFRNALDIDRDFLSARENFDGISNLLVERWHFRMLNDIERNRAFECAIERAVKKQRCSAVVDIGCGTGILSMFASRAGADCVYACDFSETMCDIAAKALQANGMLDHITLHHMMSMDMKIPDHLPERVPLVVTETVDVGLLGEGIVPTVRHAWKELLRAKRSASPGKVIPSTATVYGCLIECEHVRRHSRLCSDHIEGIDYSQLYLIGSNHRDFYKNTHTDTGKMY